MEELTLLEKLINGQIDTLEYFGQKSMSRDPYKLFPSITTWLSEMDNQKNKMTTQQNNLITLKNDCKDVILGNFTKPELQEYINSH